MKGITWSICCSTSYGVLAWLMAASFTRTSMSASNKGARQRRPAPLAPLCSTMPS
jgi:hypothetical protein